MTQPDPHRTDPTSTAPDALTPLHARPRGPDTDPDGRDFRFALVQYDQFSERVTELQREREIWIRHSILATFAFFGWLGTYMDDLDMNFMLSRVHFQVIYLIPFVFNAGGALRFFFIQRDINRHTQFLVEMERETLCLSDHVCDAPSGRGLRDRHWHWPSVCYWASVCGLSALVAAALALEIGPGAG